MKAWAPLVVLGLAMAGCASSPSPVEPPAALKEVDPALEISVAWSAQLDAGAGDQYLALGPAVKGELLFAPARHGLLRAYSATEGNRIWSKSLGLPISTGIVDAGDLLLVGSVDEVVALKSDTAEVHWRAELGSEIVTDPARSGDVIVARTVDGALYGLSANDGQRLWRNGDQRLPLLSLRGQGKPVPVGEVVVAGFANGRVATFALQNGEMVWESPVGEGRGRTELERVSDVDGQIVIDNGMVFASSYHGRVAAVALPTGRLLWSREISSYQGVTAADNTLYVSDVEGSVWALSQNSGATLWRQPELRGRGLSTPTVQGNYLVVGDYDGYIHWLSREDGRFLARMRVQNVMETFPEFPGEPGPPKVTTDRNILAPPVVAGNMVFAVDKRGALTAFRVKTGAKP